MKISQTAARLLRFLNALDATPWEESEHPRESDGKFAPKGGGGSSGGSAKPTGPSEELLRQCNKALGFVFQVKRSGEEFARKLTGVLNKLPEGTALDIQPPDVMSDETYTAIRENDGWHLSSGGSDKGVVETSDLVCLLNGVQPGENTPPLITAYNPDDRRSGHSDFGTDKRKRQVAQVQDLAKRSIQFRIVPAVTSPDSLAQMFFEDIDFDSEEEVLALLPQQTDVTRGLTFGKRNEASIPRSALRDGADHYTMVAILASAHSFHDKDDTVRALQDERYCAQLFDQFVKRREEMTENETRDAERYYDRAFLDRQQGEEDRVLNDVAPSESTLLMEFDSSETSPATDYLRQVFESRASLDLRSYAVQHAYVHGGLGTNAEALNRKMYTGEALNPAEQEYVEILRSTAVPAKQDMVLYRMADKDFIYHLLGAQALRDPSSAAGAEVELPSFSSSTAGAYESTWERCKCVMRLHLSAGQKAIFPDNTGEGEVILLNGAKIRVRAARVLAEGERLPCHVSESYRHSADCSGKLIYDVEVTADGSDA